MTDLITNKDNVTPGMAAKPPLSGIGGWLFLPLLVLVLQPILFLKELATFLGHPGVFRFSLNIYIFLYDIILSLLSVHIVYFLLKRKAVAPVYFILGRTITFVLWSFIFFAGLDMPMTQASQLDLTRPFFAHLVGLFVLVPYFLFSKRVQNTFSEPLEKTVSVERIVIPLEPGFLKWWSFFTRTRKWIFLQLLGFAILVILLGILITALF